MCTQTQTHTRIYVGFPHSSVGKESAWLSCGSAGKESACNVGDLGSTPGLRRTPGEGKGHLMWRADSLEKSLMLGKIEGRRKRGRQRIRCLDGITDLMGMSLSSSRCWWWTGKPGMLQPNWSKKSDITEQLIWLYIYIYICEYIPPTQSYIFKHTFYCEENSYLS